MADRIIIVGTRRAGAIIPTREIVQMAGRCARRPGEHGIADVISHPSDVESVREAMVGGSGLEVESQLCGANELAFHIIAEIAAMRIISKNDATKWWSRSFAAKTGRKNDINGAWDTLLEMGMINDDGITPLGSISADLYFHPKDVNAWKENFAILFSRELEKEDAAVAWAASHSPCGRSKFHTQDYEVLEGYNDHMRSYGFENEGTVGWGLAWWAALGGYRAKGIGPLVGELKRDSNRYVLAFKRISEVCRWNKEDFFDTIGVRIKRGMSQEFSGLCSIAGISRTFAEELVEMGCTKTEEINDMWDMITEYGSERLVRTLLEADFGN
jgi:hypothetical protein